jgi:Uri superfamily endonuclease
MLTALNSKEIGTYALVIFSKDRLCLPIGKLGARDFPSGYYIYAGSALTSLRGRLKRHLTADKILRWHIDYLLQRTSVKQIWYSLSHDRLECKWNAILAELPGSMPFIRGFGSSDCMCQTHLTHFLITPSFSSFKQELKNHGLPPLYQLTI